MEACLDILGYVDLQEVGAGGFGRVYRARQPSFDRTVAIKLLNGRLDDEDTMRRFQRECQALGAVSSHPNIVPVHDAGGTAAGQPYLVMDFVRGGSLADRLTRHGPLPWTEVAAIGVKISGALHSAHLAGVLHRDIKPENILVSGYGEPLLADFGIAQRAGIENRTATAASLTPYHAAPEQFTGAAPSQVTDVYALASTLFTLLAGNPPFRGRPGESVFAMVARAATEPVPDLRRSGVPDPLARVIERTLDKDPTARPQTALALGNLLQEVQLTLRTAVTTLPVEGPGIPPAAGPGREPPVTAFVPSHPPRSATPPPPARRGGKRPARLLAGAAVVALVLFLISHVSDLGPEPDHESISTRSSTTSSAEGSTTSSAETLDGKLLMAGQAPLIDWTDARVPDPIDDSSSQSLCGKDVSQLSRSRAATVVMVKPSTRRILIQQVFLVSPAKAAAAMKQLRVWGTACHGPDVGLPGQDTIGSAQPVSVRSTDEAIGYGLRSRTAGISSIYFRRGGSLCSVTLSVTGSAALQDADRAVLLQAAAEAARRLGPS